MSGCRVGAIRMKAGGATVRILSNPNKGCNDIPDMLRESANNIESGRVPIQTMCAVAVSPDGEYSIYGWGEFGDNSRAEFIGMLQIGIARAVADELAEAEK